jgi:hypothetical protein
MDIRHGSARYLTEREHDHKEGWVALKLVCVVKGTRKVAGRLVYWDADGQFSLEMKVSELPLRVVEKLIQEAKDTIRVG